MKKVILLLVFTIMLLPNIARSASWNDAFTAKPKGVDEPVGKVYFNLGGTGIRARYYGSSGTEMYVKYVFANSPAAGLVQVNDVIEGVNGSNFNSSQNISDKWDETGPFRDIGLGIIYAYKYNNGLLELNIQRGNQDIDVFIQLDNRYKAAYSKSSWPPNLNDPLITDAADYLVAQQKPDGSWQGGDKAHLYNGIALLATGDEKYRPYTRLHAQYQVNRTLNYVSDLTKISGAWRYYGGTVFLAEYYLRYREAWVIPALERSRAYLYAAQVTSSEASAFGRSYQTDSWGHGPVLAHYGSLTMGTCWAVTCLSLLDRCGLSIDRDYIDSGLDEIDDNTNSNDSVTYGGNFSGALSGDVKEQGRTQMSAIAHYLYPYNSSSKTTRARNNADEASRGSQIDSLFMTHGLHSFFWLCYYGFKSF